MLKATVGLGALVEIDLGIDGRLDEIVNKEHFTHVATVETKDGKLTYMSFMYCDVITIAKNLKYEPLLNSEEVELNIKGKTVAKDGTCRWVDVLKFKGTIYDAILVAAKEGAKYDI